MKLTIQTYIIIVLVILLVIASYFLWFDKYQITTAEEIEALALDSFQKGAQQGYEQAVISLMNEAANCKPVPVYYNNNTINMIAVECLQRGE
ncbi:hypothetical protein KY328_03420 [Candidatus Woesearchaeota archaeon]|nr:hypothetical protein [Candidatus Woesearchaeota archaeon]MBW3021944.1 hypothetical protein [Candidatus Woesearchaeota archaeon]